jgi:hypothetical protein
MSSSDRFVSRNCPQEWTLRFESGGVRLHRAVLRCQTQTFGDRLSKPYGVRAELDSLNCVSAKPGAGYLPPSVMTDYTADLAATSHMLCCCRAMYFSANASS